MRTVGQRIRYARELRRLTQAELARRLGTVERGAVGNWERDKGIKTENLIALARELDCSVEWLAKGKGAPPTEAGATSDLPASDYRPVAAGQSYKPQISGARPEIDVRAGAGEGAVGEHEVVALGSHGAITGHRVLAEWYFPPAFLRGELKAVPNRIVVIEVQGDSMVPTLLPGERIIVDTGQAAFGPDAIYLINDSSGPRVKRLHKVLSTGRIEIISDNQTGHGNDIMPLDDQIQIIGRVVGRISRL